MKLCKAWPDACTNSNAEADLQDQKKEKKNILLPKSTVDRVVDSAVATILKDAFGASELGPVEDPGVPVAENNIGPVGPVKNVGLKDDNVVKFAENHVRLDASAFSASNINIIWIAFAILSLLSIFAYQNLLYKIESMEAWLHGRLSSRP